MESIAIAGTPRVALGKKGSKATKNDGLVPCVIYGGTETIHFATSPKEVRHLVYTPDFKTAKITIGGKTVECIVKSMQFHPVSEVLMHMDFLELVPGKQVKVGIPVRFKGVSPGVKAGGKLLQMVRRVEIKTTPDRLVDELILDISGLDLGQSIRVRDITVGEGVEIINSPSIPVAIIEIPRALRSAETEAAKAKK